MLYIILYIVYIILYIVYCILYTLYCIVYIAHVTIVSHQLTTQVSSTKQTVLVPHYLLGGTVNDTLISLPGKQPLRATPKSAGNFPPAGNTLYIPYIYIQYIVIIIKAVGRGIIIKLYTYITYPGIVSLIRIAIPSQAYYGGLFYVTQKMQAMSEVFHSN